MKEIDKEGVEWLVEMDVLQPNMETTRTMTEDQLRDELDNWERVRYRMEEEGMEYCFRHYSSFPEVKDEEFHLKREKLVALMNEIEQYVEDKITEVEDKIIALEE